MAVGGTASLDSAQVVVYYSIPITVGTPIGGSVTLVAGRKYYTCFRNSITTHCSDLSAESASTGPLTAQNVPLSDIPVSSDPQVDRVLVLATADGEDPATLYLLADLPNGSGSVTDDVTEAILLDAEVFHDTDDFGTEHGVANNTPPPNGTIPIKHQGRLFMVAGQFVYFSKNLEELTTGTGLITGKYEEAWPADYFFDVSAGAETPRALLSDGQALYVGTERTIHRLYGNGPLNFQKPDVLFTNVGVLSQETFKPVFLQGSPVGAIWLTPDFRVIGSDFNTYKDIGSPIQDILNDISTGATSTCCSTFFSDGQFDLYLLSIPVNTSPFFKVCVYDLKARNWSVWDLTDQLTAWLYNIQASGIPQLLFGTAASFRLYKFNPASVQDRVNDTPTNFTVTIQTPWLHLGDPSIRKLLNEIEIMTQDSALTLSVEGASTDAEFTSPLSIVSAAPLVTSPFGEYKVYLASKTCKDRYYRFTFVSAGQVVNVLDSFNISLIPFHRL